MERDERSVACFSGYEIVETNYIRSEALHEYRGDDMFGKNDVLWDQKSQKKKKKKLPGSFGHAAAVTVYWCPHDV